GLFRLAAAASVVKKLKICLNQGTVDHSEFSMDPHAVAGVGLSACFCYRYLVQFLSLLSEQQAVNKMTPSNIAIVLGPNLLSVSSRSGTTTWGSPTPETAANDNAGSSGSPMFESSTVTAPSPSSGSGSTPYQIPSPPPRSTVPAPNPGGQMRNLTQRQSLDQVQLEPILEAPPESPKAMLTIGSPYKQKQAPVMTPQPPCQSAVAERLVFSRCSAGTSNTAKPVQFYKASSEGPEGLIMRSSHVMPFYNLKIKEYVTKRSKLGGTRVQQNFV
ncbi:hypothetical protein XENOCAPTIV_001742, partial [Xenoophorus captivus]